MLYTPDIDYFFELYVVKPDIDYFFELYTVINSRY